MTVYPRVSNTVGKLGENIATVNLPTVTCRLDAPCRKGCYANKGNFAYVNVKTSLDRNYESYKEDPVRFFKVIDNTLEMLPYKFFRWHSSGEIVDLQYLDNMCKLARKHKGTQFLCFTKKYELVNNYLNNHKKPSNLILVLSNWGDWVAENPHNLPTAWVEFGKESDSLIPNNAMVCKGSCAECVNTKSNCWRMKKGDAVKFHKH